MLIKTAKICLLAALVALGASSCGRVKRGEYAEGSATICCDEGFKNILEEEIQVFEYQYPNSSIIPYYVSEQAAIDSLMEGKTLAAITTRELTKDQIRDIKNKHKRVVRTNCIAVDAVALIVNKDNPVSLLSMDEIKEILEGKITRWNQLAGKDTTKIKLVFDDAGSSTVSYLREKFLNGKRISDNPNAYSQKSNAQVFDVVKKDPNSIGVISVSWLGDNLQTAKKVPMDKKLDDLKNETDTVAPQLTTEVRILKVRENDNPVGFLPYQVYINSGEYPLYRKVYMLSCGSPSTVMHSFYTFVTGFIGQKIISLSGIMPYHVHSRVVQLK